MISHEGTHLNWHLSDAQNLIHMVWHIKRVLRRFVVSCSNADVQNKLFILWLLIPRRRQPSSPLQVYLSLCPSLLGFVLFWYLGTVWLSSCRGGEGLSWCRSFPAPATSSSWWPSLFVRGHRCWARQVLGRPSSSALHRGWGRCWGVGGGDVLSLGVVLWKTGQNQKSGTAPAQGHYWGVGDDTSNGCSDIQCILLVITVPVTRKILLWAPWSMSCPL